MTQKYTITNGLTLLPSDNGGTLSPPVYITGPDGIDGPAGTTFTLTNEGTVRGTSGYGISLAQGGTITNTGSGSIYGSRGGIYIYGSSAAYAALIVNSGFIDGPTGGVPGIGIYLKSVGQITNLSTGEILSGSGVRIAGPDAVVNNQGFITGNYTSPGNYGVYLKQSGTVTNGQSGGGLAIIDGYAGVAFKSSPITLPGTVYNYGTILGDGTEASAVDVDGGGLLINGGSGATNALIESGRWGVYFGLGATVNNFATIKATGNSGSESGVFIDSGPAVVNNLGASASISGYVGVTVAYGTVTNSGTIASTQGASGTAVSFISGSNLLVVDPGAVFVGTVAASSNNYNSIELGTGGAGSIDDIGSSFTNFGFVSVDPGADWTLTGQVAISNPLGPGGITIEAGASLDVAGALDSADTFGLFGGSLEIAGTVPADSAINLSIGSSNALQLDGVVGTTLPNLIRGFGVGDTITLPNVTFATGTFDVPNGDTLSVPLAGGGDFSFADLAPIGANRFTASGHTVKEIASAVACFAAGTRIRTERGEIAVEALCAGETVVLADGRTSEVVWIGRRALSCHRHPEPELVWPVRVAAGALGNRLPVRDLLLSPDHALFLHGMLIPVRLLINGAGIARVPVDRITYYHVQLPHHDLLLAEGVAAESYLDTGNRAMFENGGQPLRLHPDFAGEQRTREAMSCAPFVLDAAQVEPVWRELAAMGGTPPEPARLTDEPDLHVLAGTKRINPIRNRNGVLAFAIPPGAAPLRLVSRAARPSDARPWLDDGRRLGVKVRRLSARCGRDLREVAIDDPTLRQGWWAVERDAGGLARWTDGDAMLPALGFGVLEVELAGTMRYPVQRGAIAERRIA